MKVAFITGITGQDGSYLAELLLEKDYIIHGLIRRSSSFNTDRIEHIYKDKHEENCRLILHYGDMSDALCLSQIIQECQPDEIYNLAAMSHVRVSFDTPDYTGDIDALGTTRLLEAARKMDKPFKFYQAGTSELYGGVYTEPQDETTPFYPRSPYAVAKLYAYWITQNYREAYNIFAVNGILFNHTSPRRGPTFAEQKIVQAAVSISSGRQECLYLGNIYSYRDIGHAKDYVESMWLMLQQDEPDDYVVATGQVIQIKEIVNTVFDKVGLPLTWEGEGVNEVGKHGDRILVRIDPKYYRPTEVDNLCGNASKARNKLGWKPKSSLDSILSEMIMAAQFKVWNNIIK